MPNDFAVLYDAEQLTSVVTTAGGPPSFLLFFPSRRQTRKLLLRTYLPADQTTTEIEYSTPHVRQLLRATTLDTPTSPASREFSDLADVVPVCYDGYAASSIAPRASAAGRRCLAAPWRSLRATVSTTSSVPTC